MKMKKITATTTIAEAIEILTEDGMVEIRGAVFNGNCHIANKSLEEFAISKIEREKDKEKPQAQTVWMKYSEYKNNYSDFKTVPNSYDKKDKTILVILSDAPAVAKKVAKAEICPRCGTYCYGDCSY